MHTSHIRTTREIVSSADYNLDNPDTPWNRGIPADNHPSRFCLATPFVMSGIVIMTRVYTSRFRAELRDIAGGRPHDIPAICGPHPVTHIVVTLPGGFMLRGGKVFIGGRTPVSLINGETHARKNARRFRSAN